MAPFEFEAVRTSLDDPRHFADFINSPYYTDAVYDRFSDAEHRRRFDLTRAKMGRLGLDGLIVCGGPSHWSYGGGVLWLANHREWHAMCTYLFVPREGEPTLLYGMGGTHIEATRRAVAVRDVRPAPRGQFGEVLATCIKEAGIERGRIGITVADPRYNDYLPVNQYVTLARALPDATLEFVGDFFHEFLVVKSAEELARVRKAGELCARALLAMADAARPGAAEWELKAAAAAAMLQGGGELDFVIVGATPMDDPRMVFGNPRPSGRRLQRGDIVLNEVAAGYEGYTAQMGVPICVGPPTGHVRRIFDEVVLPGFQTLAAELRPGNTFQAMARHAGFFRARGYQSRPIILHSLDLVTHAPDVRVDGAHGDPNDMVMKPGMTVMLEPNLITPDGLLGLFFGHTFIITETGAERLGSQVPLDLLVAGV
ncbi:MAG: M24 family metallopeptidase [Armatimonadota bacterium]|nr:M24 family metallopeptidase [Armatimonadota bacterium]MDR7486823.1 M24 family metallopeptidase [Armatimonadota bacterium]MDR7533838.1 M24 family metallopeptidase [Armatimonadota bacterium]MDR7535086.1 M24 family metallopeptidase [Armatimonadota bacterium]